MLLTREDLAAIGYMHLDAFELGRPPYKLITQIGESLGDKWATSVAAPSIGTRIVV